MPKAWVEQATRRRLPSDLDRAVEEGSLVLLRRALQYGCRREQLHQYGARFVELSANERTLQFLRAHPPHSVPAAFVRAVAGAGHAGAGSCVHDCPLAPGAHTRTRPARAPHARAF